MISNNYKKIAILEYGKKITAVHNGDGTNINSFVIPLNLSFKPSIIIFSMQGYGYGNYENSYSNVLNVSLNSLVNNSSNGFGVNNNSYGRWWISDINQNSFKLNVTSATYQSEYTWLLPPMKIIAIE